MSLPREKVTVYLAPEVHEAMKHISEVDGAESMQKWCEAVITAKVTEKWMQASSLAARLASINLARHVKQSQGINVVTPRDFADTQFADLDDADR